ncbi:YesL family protein [Lactiplantibacillus paraplantarum]|uniref:YesL family protein n=1 Tax=Lactiplantibacillus paraplantarum TaxID=60520 RepID=UPI003DA36B4F
MIGRAADKIFTRVFIFLIMTVYFWIYTVAGLVVLGIGPAFRTVTEMHMDKQWDYRLYHFKEGWQRFKRHFWQMNLHTWLLLGVGAVLAYNLYLSLSIHTLWIIFIQFIIVFALIFDFSLAIFTVMLRSRYDVAFKDAIKLAIVQFFSNFTQLLTFIIGTIVLIVISLKWPGMILFLSPGIYMVGADRLSRRWYDKIDKMLGAV